MAVLVASRLLGYMILICHRFNAFCLSILPLPLSLNQHCHTPL